MNCKICNSDNVSQEEKAKRTSGPAVKGKLMSYGYFYTLYTCADCKHSWEIIK